jgi:hypothetical protein
VKNNNNNSEVAICDKTQARNGQGRRGISTRAYGDRKQQVELSQFLHGRNRVRRRHTPRSGVPVDRPNFHHQIHLAGNILISPRKAMVVIRDGSMISRGTKFSSQDRIGYERDGAASLRVS